ncbi:hypothetical protein HTZ84_09710 [Haloterrigena sp. SYSU A558-1]|uniref:Uncharacterized protein n=1 Tax=Haloterrigena gelatinilytica TaxID=2741724 RepID=A0ABX2LA06_9EURY|nr:hypothetical protein [Haloterrigena gelatinilytica]NUC72581.1 hypothetical protein [Haloterrigena gelatinilytica]
MKHGEHVRPTGEMGWHKIADYPEFVKFQYGDSPYRVVVHLNDRGHFEALFTSWYGGASFRIRGNCGGGHKGRMIALVAARDWMDENKYGCAPPREMAVKAGQVEA